MADDTTINTSNIDDTTTAVEGLTDAISAGPEATRKYAEHLIELFGGKALDNISNFKKVFDDLSKNFKDADRNMEELGNTTQAVFKDGKINDSLDNILSSVGKLSTILGGTKLFDNFSTDSAIKINSIGDNIGGLIAKTKLLSPAAAEAFTAFTKHADNAEKLETSYVSLAAASGNLNSVFDQETGTLKDLSGLTASYMQNVSNAATATGLGTTTALNFSNALKGIPGVLNENIKSGKDTTDSTSSLIASMKLMTGTGQDQKDIISELKNSYDNLSQSQGMITDSGQKAVEFISTMSSVSNTLGLNLTDVKGVMENVAKGFADIGNETDATAKIIGRYTQALRETGLTSKESLNITQTMIDNLGKMTTATKAFLSARSGGVGGLQGSLQIDELLRKGKVDEVARMAETALKKQFGGRIVTQEEGATSQQAAAQFTRQRMMLQSGAFGIGKGTSDAQAARLLESLAKGDTGAAAKEIKTGQDAVKDSLNKGTQIQERNNNELKNMGVALDSIETYASIQAGALIKQALGTGNKESATTARLAGTMNSATMAGNELNQRQKGYETRSSKSPGGLTAEDAVLELALTGRNAVKQLVNTGKSIGKSGMEGIEGSTILQKIFGTIAATVETKKQTLPIQLKEDHTKKQPGTMYNAAVATASHPATTAAHRTAAATVSAAAMADKHTTNKTQNQKIVLEIVPPAGFGVKQKSATIPEVEVRTPTQNYNDAASGIHRERER